MVNNNAGSPKKYLSTAEAAVLLGISRIMVFKRIKSGVLRAERFGRNWLVPAKAIIPPQTKALTAGQKSLIDMGVAGVVRQYKETLRLLGNT